MVIYKNIIRFTDPFCREGMSHALGATYLYKAGETCDGSVASFLLSLQSENPEDKLNRRLSPQKHLHCCGR